MPELPEVETTRLALEPHLRGQRVAWVQVRRRDLRQPIPPEFEQQLTGQRITQLRRIGKYLLLDAENGQTALVHLGMSGSFRVAPGKPNELKTHDHLLLGMESGAVAIFHDPRRFGVVLNLATKTALQHPLLAKMGADPLEEAVFTVAYLHTMLAKRKQPVKLAIMDQHLVTGVGNIYASEALFEARIHPQRAAASITRKEAANLVQAIRNVLHAALKSGGSTLRDYMSGESVSGYFQHSFAVYDRAGEACKRCQTGIAHCVMSNRATYYCPRCQKH